MRSRVLAFAVASLLLAGAGTAGAMTPRQLLSDGHVRVRVRSEPARQVLIGQQTRFFVEILTDTWFTKAPLYPELTLEGAVSLMPEQLGTNFTERIDGTTFAAQTRSYVIFPQRAGPLEIPSLRIRLGVAGPDGKATEPFSIRTRPLRLNVILPAEAEGVDGLVTTPRLRIRETFDRPLDGLVVGDAIKRSVRIDAERSLGMLLPDLAFDAPPGIAAYPDSPRLEDRVNRGQYAGQRTESVTYVLQEPGAFTLPAIEIHWWNPAWGSLSTETLEARSFEVGGSATTAAPRVAPADPWAPWRRRAERALLWAREHAWALLLGALGTLLTVRTLRRFAPVWLGRWREAKLRRRESEARFFHALERSLRRKDADAVVSDYWRWRERLAAETDARSAALAGEAAALAETWARLERQRYADADDSIDWQSLRSALRAFRTAARRSATPPARAFGVLNPTTKTDLG